MLKTLSYLVDSYLRNQAYEEEHKLSDFKRNAERIEELVRKAVYGIKPNTKRDSHEVVISDDVLKEMVVKLSDEVVLDKFWKCKYFEDIMALVYSQKVKGFGPLCVYDTALRLGAILNIYPKAVYLHRGTYDGAKNLFGNDFIRMNAQLFKGDRQYPYLEKDCFPLELQRLEVHHIENFLCSRKDDLAFK